MSIPSIRTLSQDIRMFGYIRMLKKGPYPLAVFHEVNVINIMCSKFHLGVLNTVGRD